MQTKLFTYLVLCSLNLNVIFKCCPFVLRTLLLLIDLCIQTINKEITFVLFKEPLPSKF